MPVYTVGQLVTAANLNSMAQGLYRKTAQTAATNTVADTALLGGATIVAGNVMSTDRLARLTALGDWSQNGAVGLGIPRFKLKLGSGLTTVIDTGAPAGDIRLSANYYGWKIVAEIMNKGATNAQLINFQMTLAYNIGVGAGITATAYTTGEGSTGTASSAGTPTTGVAVSEGINASTIDTTANWNIELSVINPTATATCETICRVAIVEIL